MLKIGSVNNAVMLKKLIEKSGLDAYVVRTPPELNKGGCSYSVKIRKNILDTAKSICHRNHIHIKGIYADRDGEYYDIS